MINLKGGVIGGSITKGVIKASAKITFIAHFLNENGQIGDTLEIRPGICFQNPVSNKFECHPIITCITSLYSEEQALDFAVPGGLIGIGTNIDPSLCRDDRLVGQTCGKVGKLPEIFSEAEISYFLMRRVVGRRPENETDPQNLQENEKKSNRVAKLCKNELLKLNINSSCVGGKVTAVNSDLVKIRFSTPVCAAEGTKVVISRKMDQSNWRLIGYGRIEKGGKSQIQIL